MYSACLASLTHQRSPLPQVEKPNSVSQTPLAPSPLAHELVNRRHALEEAPALVLVLPGVVGVAPLVVGMDRDTVEVPLDAVAVELLEEVAV